MRVAFPLPLEVEAVSDVQWKLTNNFNAIVEEQGQDPLVLDVPTGFVTDFASVPRAPFAYLLFGGIGNKAAAIHDWLYSRGEYPREWCDAVFRAGLIEQGIEAWKADTMYAAVRQFGASHYMS